MSRPAGRAARVLTHALLWAAISGCAVKQTTALDDTLPDATVSFAESPAALLDAAISERDPSVRGRALAWKVRLAPADGLTRWSMQGVYDPEPLVQRFVTEALLERIETPGVLEDLVGFAQRGSADPYAREAVVAALVELGHGADLVELPGAWRDKPGWKAAPLALAALSVGDEDAQMVLDQVLARGAVRDEVAFLVRAAVLGGSSSRAAMREASNYLEDSTARMYDFAMAVAGDRRANATWSATWSDPDVEVVRESLEWILALDGEARRTWAKRAKRARDRGVKQAARVVARPSMDRMVRVLSSEGAFAREVVMREAVGLPIEQARDVLKYGLVDDDAAVRLAAAEAAAHLSDDALQPYLEPLLLDDRAVLRVSAAAALLRARTSE